MSKKPSENSGTPYYKALIISVLAALGTAGAVPANASENEGDKQTERLMGMVREKLYKNKNKIAIGIGAGVAAILGGIGAAFVIRRFRNNRDKLRAFLEGYNEGPSDTLSKEVVILDPHPDDGEDPTIIGCSGVPLPDLPETTETEAPTQAFPSDADNRTDEDTGEKTIVYDEKQKAHEAKVLAEHATEEDTRPSIGPDDPTVAVSEPPKLPPNRLSLLITAKEGSGEV